MSAQKYLSRCFWLALSFSLCGCPRKPFSEMPVRVLGQSRPTTADGCQSIDAVLDEGVSSLPFSSHPARGALIVSARCEDETICVAGVSVVSPSRANVLGKSAGETFVALTLEHPITHERTEAKEKVTFTEPSPGDVFHPRPKRTPETDRKCLER